VQVLRVDNNDEKLIQRYLKIQEQVLPRLRYERKMSNTRLLEELQLNDTLNLWVISTESQDVGFVQYTTTDKVHVTVEIEIVDLREREWKRAMSQILRGLNEDQIAVVYWNWTEDRDPQIRWFKEIGAEVTLVEHFNRLILKEVNWELVEEVVDTYEVEGLEISVHYSDEIFQRYLDDQEFVEEMADFKTATHADVPNGTSSLAPKIYTAGKLCKRASDRIGNPDYNFILVLAMDSGRIVGSTKVNLHGSMGHNGMTGVRRESRGRSLATYLKSFSLLYLRENHPEIKYVTTENAEMNAPILRLNHRLGFKKLYDKLRIELHRSDLRIG